MVQYIHMKITDKHKLLRALITAPTKQLILEFTNCYLNIYCLGDTYCSKVESIQTNSFNGYLVIDKNHELINILKDCCTKKSSELEFKYIDATTWLQYKRSNKEDTKVLEAPNLEEYLPKQLTTYLDIIDKQEFSNERLLTYKEYTTKLTTKYEYEVVDINKGVLISNKDLELVPKVFDIEHKKIVTLKSKLDISNLKKKDIDNIKSNKENIVITYEDLVVSNSEELIQITNIEADTYYYCKRCFKLND